MREIRALKNVVDLHLSVEYDEPQDKLLFNRVLQCGSGSSIYGLEFAKSLHMDSDFLDTANKIRKRLANDFDELELLVKKKTSKYNKDLYVTKCVICGAMAEDVHHIYHNHSRTATVLSGIFTKTIAQPCSAVQKTSQRDCKGKIKVDGFVMTSKGLELKFEEQISKAKEKKDTEPQINEIKGFVLDDWE